MAPFQSILILTSSSAIELDEVATSSSRKESMQQIAYEN
jgi:hypothetical protein